MHDPRKCIPRLYSGCLILSVQIDHAAELRDSQTVLLEGHDGFEHDVYRVLPQKDATKPHELQTIGRFANLGLAIKAAQEAAKKAVMDFLKQGAAPSDAKGDAPADAVETATAPAVATPAVVPLLESTDGAAP
jgi:hypothetical protein